MKKSIRVNFSDFWENFNPEESLIFNMLKKKFRVTLSENPEYLFYSCYGYEHLKYDSIKIFFSGENVLPDFNVCDYAIGPHYLNFGDRYIRIPLFSLRKSYLNLTASLKIDRDTALNRKFCNFLYSNKDNAHPIRKIFFDKLCEYKKVDSGGGYLNNMGERVVNKLPFISDYKFTIAFENSTVTGYTTEKLTDPMSVNSLPVYWGNPVVERDFNASSFIRLKNSSDNEIEKAIDKIIYLDKHDDEYMNVLKKSWLIPVQFIDTEKELSDFFEKIVSKPYNEALKTAKFGYNKYDVKRLREHMNGQKTDIGLIRHTEKYLKKIKSRLIH